TPASPTQHRSPPNIKPDPAMAVSYTTSADATRRLGHANASVTTRHYARAVDERDAEVAQHLDASRAKVARRSGTQRARKPRKADQ
ncbi:hypothetical protein, partial [Micromonospora globbae]|uniref:hypothetical protein n=1 Tax=Micromonospora globbae TaxID=1894969 RepID=UPI00342AD331